MMRLLVRFIELAERAAAQGVTPEQIAQYRRDGHIVLRGVASPEEAAAYEPVISRAVEQFNAESRPLAERDTYGKAFLQVMNLWVRDEAVRRYVMARRFEYLHIEKRLDKLVLVVQAMWSLVAEKSGLTETDLLRRVTELDAQDGAVDGRITRPPVRCSKCDATICRKFNRCLFCGQEYTGGSAFDIL